MKSIMLSALVLAAFSAAALAQSANQPTQARAAHAPAAAAAPAAPQRVKMSALISSGYEIKAVTLVPQDASSRVAQKPDKDAALVTLQKGSAVATCFLALDAYVSPGMLDIPWCLEQK